MSVQSPLNMSFPIPVYRLNNPPMRSEPTNCVWRLSCAVRLTLVLSDVPSQGEAVARS